MTMKDQSQSQSPSVDKKQYIIYYERFSDEIRNVYSFIVDAEDPEKAVDAFWEAVYDDPQVDFMGVAEYMEKPVRETFLSRKDPMVDVKELLYARLEKVKAMAATESFYEALELSMKMGPEEVFLQNLLDIIERS